MKRRLQSYFATIRAASNDLPLYWLLHVFLIAGAVIAAKARAVSHAYGVLAWDRYIFLLLHALPFDLINVAGLFLMVLLARRLPSPHGKLRSFIFVLAPISTLVCAFLAHFNFGYYSQMGQPLNAGLLSVAPHMAGYLLPSVNMNAMLLLAAILLASVLILAVSPLAVARMRLTFLHNEHWHRRPWIYFLLLTGLTFFLLSRPALGVRETALREMTVLSIFSSPPNENAPYSLDDSSRAALLKLCGPVDMRGKEEFAALPRRAYNIVFWVLESTGTRYLKSMHPLGNAATPNLDKAIASGAVSFDNCYSECPLSVQSGWAILTGSPPPPYPTQFIKKPMLPAHEPQITTVLKENGYNTAVIIGGPTPIWGLDKIVKSGRVDHFADLDALQAAGYKAEGWSIEGRGINESFLKFIDSKPGQPFFGLLWHVESHHPFRWVGYTKDESAMKYADRYRCSIEHVDRLFGSFYSELEKRNLLKDTIIVVVGDHGEGMGRGPRPYDLSHSHQVYEDAIHVPLFFLNPAFKGSSRHVQAPCSHIDLLPTVLDLCGIPINPALSSVSLARPIESRPFFARSQQVWPMSIRAGDYKLVLANSQAVPELYDLKKDLMEEHNLAGSQKKIADLLAAAIRENASRLSPSASRK